MNGFNPGLSLHRVLAGLAERGRRELQRLELHWFAAQQYTALLPVKFGSAGALRAVLTDVHSKRPFKDVPGLHSLRWTLVDPREQTPAARGRPWLVVALVCDGSVWDVLEELAEAAVPELDAISQHCLGCPARVQHGAWVDYLRKHRLSASHVFRGPRELDASAGPLNPSARELRFALDRWQRLRRFVVDHQDESLSRNRGVPRIAALRALATDGDIAQQRPLSPVEQAIDHEGVWLRRVADMATARVRRDVRARRRVGEAVPGLRLVHAKHHGFIRASFHVRDDVPARFRQGVLVPGNKYEAWLRPSNANLAPIADWLPDSRGLAIKLIDVPGQQLLDPALPNGVSERSVNAQDFVLVSKPTFFVRDARDYAIFRSLLDARPDGPVEQLMLMASGAGFALRRPRELASLLSTVLVWCSHPLQLEYHSMVAFQLGIGQAVKWSVRPTPATALRLSEGLSSWARGFAADPNDYLRVALQRSLDQLDGATLELEFALHVPGAKPLTVEDARVNWGEEGAERIVVATLSIAAQDATSPERMAEAERMVMSPWHTLEAHRPLGSLNRARLSAYRASSEARSQANGVRLEREAAATPIELATRGSVVRRR